MSTSENQTRQGEDVEGTQPTPTNLEAQKQPSNLAQMEKKAVASVLPMLISALPTAVSVPSSSHTVPITQAIASLFEKAPYMQPASNTPTPSSSHSSQLPSKMFEREELLKVARERRRQLEEAVMKTRTQLWETTIEHGVMTHLLKYYNK
ncbi:hypothetical protein VNI00_005083 [Paramarasmius palmivorus]|uniref:Uncharacterized protein n=1 Tax=Paramarasmius palmivorus TaxID=297713 RepID=A0AAW0DK64_9AGAR